MRACRLIDRVVTSLMLLAPATAFAAPPAASTTKATHRVVVLGDAAPADAVDEMMVHVHRHFAGAQLLRASSPEEAAAARAGGTPSVLVALGRDAASAAMAQAKSGERILWLSVPEHAAPLPSRAAPDALVSGVLDGCSLPALVRLAKRLSPEARRAGWLLPDGNSAPGAVAATLMAEADSVALSLEGPIPVQEAQALIRRVDVLLLPWAPADPAAMRAIVESAKGAGIPLYTCDEGSVKAGATAGLITDPQQVGEAAGNAALALFEGRSSRERIDSGYITLNLESTCALGISPSGGMLHKAVVHNEGHVCPPKPKSAAPAAAVTAPATPPKRRAPWSLGLFGIGAAMLMGAAVGSMTRPKR